MIDAKGRQLEDLTTMMMTRRAPSNRPMLSWYLVVLVLALRVVGSEQSTIIQGCPRGKPAVTISAKSDGLMTVIAQSEQSIEAGGFQLYANNHPLLPQTDPHAPRVKFPTREVNSITIERTSSFFQAFLLRLEGGKTGSNPISAMNVPDHGIAQYSIPCFVDKVRFWYGQVNWNLFVQGLSHFF